MIKNKQDKFTRLPVGKQHKVLNAYALFQPELSRMQLRDQVAISVASELGPWIVGRKFFQKLVDTITQKVSDLSVE